MSQQYFKPWFFTFLLSSLVLAEWNPKDFLKREHSLIKPFTGRQLLLINIYIYLSKSDVKFVQATVSGFPIGISLAPLWSQATTLD